MRSFGFGLQSVLAVILFLSSATSGFSVKMSAGKELYGIKNSGWASPAWNWGSASGTGHDCAAICRRQYSTKQSRQELVQNLLEPADNPELRQPRIFEEVKLILGLCWQNGRWDGSDGGPGGYGEVLRYMADAKRYEEGPEEECSQRFVEDMQDRFECLAPKRSSMRDMRAILVDDASDMDYARRKASGLVLDAMGFIDKGL